MSNEIPPINKCCHGQNRILCDLCTFDLLIARTATERCNPATVVAALSALTIQFAQATSALTRPNRK